MLHVTCYMRLNAQELRTVDENAAKEGLVALKRQPLYFILENVYDTYNIGGIFRLADALAVSKIYICGQSETPPNPKIKKASIGTYKIVPWEYKNTAKEAIKELRNIHCSGLETACPRTGESIQSLPGSRVGARDDINEDRDNKSNIQIVAVEQDKRSKPYTKISFHFPVALLVGNETYGVLPETLALVDKIAEIPMWGINKSLNVIVSTAIVAYHVMQAAPSI